MGGTSRQENGRDPSRYHAMKRRLVVFLPLWVHQQVQITGAGDVDCICFSSGPRLGHVVDPDRAGIRFHQKVALTGTLELLAIDAEGEDVVIDPAGRLEGEPGCGLKGHIVFAMSRYVNDAGLT